MVLGQNLIFWIGEHQIIGKWMFIPSKLWLWMAMVFQFIGFDSTPYL